MRDQFENTTDVRPTTKLPVAEEASLQDRDEKNVCVHGGSIQGITVFE